MFMNNTNCILCGAKTINGAQKCNDCEELTNIITALYDDSKTQLSTNPSVERESSFKILREFAFTVQEDSLVKTYKNTINFFMSQFMDKKNSDTTFELFMKTVITRLNSIKILSEFNEANIIKWDSSSLSMDSPHMIYPGDVIRNLTDSFQNSTVVHRDEQRYGHVLTFYSILPLLINFSNCNTKDEVKQLNMIPKKPWIILLAILIGNKDGKISAESTAKFLKSRRGIGNVLNTIFTNLSSLSPDHTQQATIGIDNGNGKSYIISQDINDYIEKLRNTNRSRSRDD